MTVLTDRRALDYAHLADAPDATLLVSACDKQHNARAMLQLLEDPAVGLVAFGRINAGAEGTQSHYRALSELLQRGVTPAAQSLHSGVEQMFALAATSHE